MTAPSVLIITTSHATLGDTNQKTGLWLEELTTPYYAFVDAGVRVTLASIKGGAIPVDPSSQKAQGENSPSVERFYADAMAQQAVANTPSIEDVTAGDYDAVFLPGGHGTMWDFADNEAIAKIAQQIYENNGVVSAVCHGPSGLVNIKLSNGKYLVDGKKINAFTNEEEVAVKLEEVVPYMLEDKLIERGAQFEKSGLWQEHVTVDQRIVTGQNPQSAAGVGEATLQEIKKLKAVVAE